MKFEWDENKAKINIEKHGITFEEASTVFEDYNSLFRDDPDLQMKKIDFYYWEWALI